jgi:hypothetical protein
MRIGIALSFIAILNITLFVPAVSADVIPTKLPSQKDQIARAAVEQRLVELGSDAKEAHDQVAILSDEVVERYADSPESVQVVTGLYFEEWLLGGVFLGLLIIIAMGLGG